MQTPLLGQWQPHGHKMGIGITTKQKHLKEQETRGPDRRRPSEPGQEILSDEQLNFEKKKSAGEDGHSDPIAVGKCGSFLVRGRSYTAVFPHFHVWQLILNLIRQGTPRKALNCMRLLNFMRWLPI